MKKLRNVLGFVVMSVVVMFVWNILTTVRKIEQFASEVKPGAQVGEARSQARQMGLKYISSSRRDEAGQFCDLVTSSGVMGRFICEVRHDGNVVISTGKSVLD